MRKYFLILFLLLIRFTSSEAQVQLSNGISYKVQSDGSQPIHYVVQDASAIKGKATADSALRVIVKFRSEPLTKSASKGLRSSVEQEHKNFENDLRKIENTISQRSSSRQSIIHQHFKNAFNGKSITASKAVIDQVKQLSYVEYVVEDKKVSVSDNSSNAIIQADKVWSQYNATGQGIVIGIIDTGIDYMHPDIGGGFGSGHKVIGGYDFVNGDSDPMDDHGHGTHVAGIAAANGTGLMGVAPDAQLMAFKVLDKNGSGYDSWILAGIERSMDPDQNPATNDHVNVVNMSLGRLANGPDPLSEAVENAVSAGIVFAIAAGNDGGYQTVASPGIAPSAITVGATDASDALAYFSSKGPARGTYTMKPDLVAPGVGIYSSFPGDKYAVLNGTSMASPHVAGAAALLLQLHPSWAPLQVKSVLMGNTKSLAAGPYDVGTGRLDILQSVQSTFGVSPGSISLSMVDLGTDVVSTSFQLTVFNYSGSQKTYNLTQSGDLGSPAITTTIDQPTLTLNSGASQVVTVNLNINTKNMVIKDLPDLYLGYINVSDNLKSIKVPVGLPNPQHLKLHFTSPMPNLIAISGVDNYFFEFVQAQSLDADIVIPQGKFDIISMYGYGNTFVVKENISIPQTSNLSIDKSEAANQLIFQPADENGKKITTISSMLGLVSIGSFTPGGAGFISFTSGIDTLYLSPLSAKWKWNFRICDFKPGSDKIYNLGYSEAGISQSKIVSNSPSDLVAVKYDFDHQSNSTVSVSNVVGVNLGNVNMSVFNSFGKTISSNFTEYFQKMNKAGSDVSTHHVIQAPEASGYNFETPGLSLFTNDSVAYRKGIFGNLTESSTFTGSSLNLKLNETLLHWSSAMINDLNLLLVNPSYLNGHFINNRGDKVLNKIKYSLSNSTGIVKSGYTLNPSTLFILGENVLQLKGIDAGSYSLQMDYDLHQVQGKFGKATSIMNFNTQLSDKNPPYITKFELKVNDHLTNQFNTGDNAIISIDLSDDCYSFNYLCNGTNSGIASYSLSYKKENDSNWTPLTLSNNEAQLPPGLTEGFYSLNLNTTDNAGNELTYTLEPAFLVGTNPNPVPFRRPFLEFPQAGNASVAQNTIFKWATLTGAVNYQFLIATDSTFSNNLQSLNFTSDSVRLSSLLDSQTKYFWKVQAIYANNVSPWSEVASFTTGTGTTGVVKLLSPEANATNLTGTINLTWASVPNAIGYQLTTTWPNPDSPIPTTYSSVTTETSAAFYPSPSTNYSWYVTPMYTGIQGEASEIRKFTTGQPLISAQNPVNNANNISATPNLAWDENFFGGIYHIVLSSNQDLSNPIVNADTYSKTYSVGGLQPSTNYFWKVSTYYSSTLFLSDLFTFRTADILGVEEAKTFFVYPNPASQVVNFRFESAYYKLNITNSLGQSIWNQEGSGSLLTWNVSSLESGLYIALITDGDKTIRQKIIISR